jgi:hypothetical protein
MKYFTDKLRGRSDVRLASGEIVLAGDVRYSGILLHVRRLNWPNRPRGGLSTQKQENAMKLGKLYPWSIREFKSEV